jgi:hypothetical protein
MAEAVGIDDKKRHALHGPEKGASSEDDSGHDESVTAAAAAAPADPKLDRDTLLRLDLVLVPLMVMLYLLGMCVCAAFGLSWLEGTLSFGGEWSFVLTDLVLYSLAG